MAVAEGRAAREGLRKLAAIPHAAARLERLSGGGSGVLSEVDFSKALRRLGLVLTEQERGAVLRRFPAPDDDGIRGVSVAPLLDYISSTQLIKPGSARRKRSSSGRPSLGSDKSTVVPEDRSEPELGVETRQPEPKPEPRADPPEPEPELPSQAQPDLEPQLRPDQICSPSTTSFEQPIARQAQGAGVLDLPMLGGQLLAAAALTALLSKLYYASAYSQTPLDLRMVSPCGDDLVCWLRAAGADEMVALSALSARGIMSVRDLLGARLTAAQLDETGVPAVPYLEAQYANLLRDQPLPPLPPVPPPDPVPTPAPATSSGWVLLGVAVLWWKFARWLQSSPDKCAPAHAAVVPNVQVSAAAGPPVATSGPSPNRRRPRILHTPNTPAHITTMCSTGTADVRLNIANVRRTPRSPNSSAGQARPVSPPMARQSTQMHELPHLAANSIVADLAVKGHVTPDEHQQLLANVQAANEEMHRNPPPQLEVDNADANEMRPETQEYRPAVGRKLFDETVSREQALAQPGTSQPPSQQQRVSTPDGATALNDAMASLRARVAAVDEIVATASPPQKQSPPSLPENPTRSPLGPVVQTSVLSPALEAKPEPEPEPEPAADLTAATRLIKTSPTNNTSSEASAMTDDVLVAGTVVSLEVGGRLMPGAVAQFGPQRAQFSKSAIVVAQPFAADGPLMNAHSLKGSVALIARGGITFVEKARRACAAGAVGILFVNHDDRPYVPLGTTAGGEPIDIPSVCVGRSDGEAIADMLTRDSSLCISHVHTGADVVTCAPQSYDWIGRNGGVLDVHSISCSGLIKTESVPKPLLRLFVQTDPAEAEPQESRSQLKKRLSASPLKRRLSASPLRPRGRDKEQNERNRPQARTASSLLATTMPTYTENFRFSIPPQPDNETFCAPRLTIEVLDELLGTPTLIGSTDIRLPDVLESPAQTVTVTQDLEDPHGDVDATFVRKRLQEMAEHAASVGSRVAHTSTLFGSVTLQLRFAPSSASLESSLEPGRSPFSQSDRRKKAPAPIIGSSPNTQTVQSPAISTSEQSKTVARAAEATDIPTTPTTPTTQAAEAANAQVSSNRVRPISKSHIAVDTALTAQENSALAPNSVADVQTSENCEKQPSPGVVNTYAELFARVDHNSDASISCSELVQRICEDNVVAGALGLPENIRDEDRRQLQAAFRDMDTDESGGVGLHEFCAYMVEKFPDGTMAHHFSTTAEPPCAAVASTVLASPDQVMHHQLNSPKVTVGVHAGSPLRQPNPSLPTSPHLPQSSAQPQSPAQSGIPKSVFEIEDLAGDRDVSEDSDTQFSFSEREHLSDTESSEGDNDANEDGENSTVVSQLEQTDELPRSPLLETPRIQRVTSPRGPTEGVRCSKPSPDRNKPLNSPNTARERPKHRISSNQPAHSPAVSVEDRRMRLQRQDGNAGAMLCEQQENATRDQEVVETRASEARAKWLENKVLQRKVEQASREKQQREQAERLQKKREQASLAALAKQERRAEELEARAASLRGDGVGDFEPVYRPGEHLECIGRAVLRSGFELNSPHLGFIPVGEHIEVLEARVNHRGQTRLRCSSGWTSAAAVNGTVLFRPVPTMLETVPEDDDEDNGQSHDPQIHREAISLLYDPPASTDASSKSISRKGPPDTLGEVEAAVELAMAIEAWLSTIPIGGSVPRRFDSAGLIQFGIEKRLYNEHPAQIYEQYVESMVADASPPTPSPRMGGGGWHGDGDNDHPLL